MPHGTRRRKDPRQRSVPEYNRIMQVAVELFRLHCLPKVQNDSVKLRLWCVGTGEEDGSERVNDVRMPTFSISGVASDNKHLILDRPCL